MKTLMRLLWPVAVVCSVSFAADYQADLYSENAFVSREDTLSSSLRVRAQTPLLPNLLPYLQFGNEMITSSNLAVDPSSYAYLAPGLKWNLGQISLYTEMRIRAFYQANVPPGIGSVGDFRALLVYGNFLQSGAGAWGVSRFLEIYAEAVFTTADGSNFIPDGYARAGFRKPLGIDAFADIFIEPYLSLDRVGHFYNNRADLKLNFRLQKNTGPLSFSLIASALANVYFPFAKADPNPYTDRTFGGRLLFVVGGLL